MKILNPDFNETKLHHSDVLTVYNNSARRLMNIDFENKQPKLVLDLPSSTIQSSILAILPHDRLRMLPFKVTGTQLEVQVPNEEVQVVNNQGQLFRGELVSVDPYEVTLRQDSRLQHILRYRNIQFNRQEDIKNVTVSYFLNNIGWRPQHTLFLDLVEMRVVAFKTVALIHNDSGQVLHLTSLRLGLGQPMRMPTDSTANVTRKMSRSASASMVEAKLSLAAAPMAMALPVEDYEFDQTNEIENDGDEDYQYIDLGPQTLSEFQRIDILNLQDLPMQKLYYYNICNNCTKVEVGYKFTLPENTRIPTGDLSIYSFDCDSEELGSYLGHTLFNEKLHEEDAEVKLGPSSLIRVQALVNRSELEHATKYAPSTKKTLIRCEFTNLSTEDVFLVASFPFPSNEDVLDTSVDYDRVKNGKMEFDLLIPPLDKQDKFIFECEITSR